MKFNDKQKLLIIVTVTFLIAILYAYQNCFNLQLTKDDLKRPDYDKDTKMTSIHIVSDSGDEINADIVLEPRHYSEDNIEEAFDEVFKRLDKIMLGENITIDEVKYDLNLVNRVDGFPMDIQWLCNNYEIIEYDGSVNNIEIKNDQSEKVDLIASCKYDGWVRQKKYVINVVSADLDIAKNRHDYIVSKIYDSINSEKEQEYVNLPETIDGANYTYEKYADWNTVLLIVLLGMAAVFAVVLGQKKSIEKQSEERKQELKRDYSEMIHKLALLMGAGMTVRMAWAHIVTDYKNKREQRVIGKKYVYEEMIETFNQLSAGVSEINAYAEFGKRCDTKEYLKFGSLLGQNLKKGSKELVKLLEFEAIDAFEERKNLAKKYGEEAGTKMLFPMVGMLVIVMAIIMIPAVMSFAI